jgi:hypothetical protein
MTVIQEIGSKPRLPGVGTLFIPVKTLTSGQSGPANGATVFAAALCARFAFVSQALLATINREES